MICRPAVPRSPILPIVEASMPGTPSRPAVYASPSGEAEKAFIVATMFSAEPNMSRMKGL